MAMMRKQQSGSRIPLDTFDPFLLKARALTILEDICKRGGSMRLSALYDRENNTMCSATFLQIEPMTFLKNFPYFFRLETTSDGDCLVHAHTRVQLCDEENGRNGCLNPHCEKLHLCKHFVTGCCKFGDK